MVLDDPTMAATEALARAWNRLDPGVVVPLLSEGVRYESIDTELVIEGRSQVASYLERKAELIALVGEEAAVRAEIGFVATPGDPRRPCVISHQGGGGAVALFLLSVDASGLIGRIEVCTVDPDPGGATGTGSFPT
jgi:hypothetical protein